MAEMIPTDQGRLRVVSVVAPAIGAEFEHTQDQRVRWRIISVKGKFTADGTVVNRFFNLDMMVGTEVVLRMPVREEATADEVWVISWYTGNQLIPDPAAFSQVGPMPGKLLMNNQMTLKSYTSGIVAGDSWTKVFILVEEWIEPLA